MQPIYLSDVILEGEEEEERSGGGGGGGEDTKREKQGVSEDEERKGRGEGEGGEGKGGRGGGDESFTDNNRDELITQAHGQEPAEVLFSATMADIDRQGVLHEMSLTITTDHLPSLVDEPADHLPHHLEDEPSDHLPRRPVEPSDQLPPLRGASEVETSEQPSEGSYYCDPTPGGSPASDHSNSNSNSNGNSPSCSNGSSRNNTNNSSSVNGSGSGSGKGRDLDWRELCLLGAYQAGIEDRLKV